MENTLSSRQNEKILSPYTENTLYCSDVYNLAQKLNNSVQIVKITGHGCVGTLSRVGELSLAERLQGT